MALVKKTPIDLSLAFIFFLSCFMGCKGQKPFGTEHLSLEKIIEMPEVKGRIDHMAINLKNNIVYIAALGNNTVEVVDLDKGLLVHTIKGLDEPQGICYISGSNEIAVANGGNGQCVFYSASTYAVVSAIDLGSDADNIRYDDINKKIYVGYGSGGIAIIDAATHKKVNDVKLPAHPESFQMDQRNHLLFVNLPDDNSITVIDLQTLKVTGNWKTKDRRANFPMALDTARSGVVVGFRHPAILVTFDAITGVVQNRTELISDVDDVFFDEKGQQIFASGGGGSINIFKKQDDQRLKKIANIPTRSGARTSLLIPSLRRFILAERSNGTRPAALAVYKIND